MAKENQNETKNETKKDAKKKPAKPTLVNVIKEHLVKGVKDKVDLKECVLRTLKERSMKVNSKGKVITPEGVVTLSNAMLRDIKNDKTGWWQTYEIKEDKTSLKIVLKPTLKKA